MKNTILFLLNKLKPKKIRTQFLVWFMFLALIPIAIITFYARPYIEQSLKKQQINQFNSLAAFQVQKIESFRDHLIDDMEILRDERRIVEPIMLHNSNPSEKQTPIQSHALEEGNKSFYKRLFHTATDHFISDFLLIDSTSQVIFSARDSLVGQLIVDLPKGQSELKTGYIKFLKQKTLYFSPTFYDERNQTPALLIFMPAYHQDKMIGSYAKVVNLTGILTDMASDYLLGKTGEMLVAQLRGDTVEFMNTLRFNTGNPFDFKLKIGATIGLPIQDALEGNEGSMVSVDYRGESVVAVWKYIKDLNWGIVVKMDEDEVLATVHDLRQQLLYFSLIILVITLVVAYLFAFTFSKPILDLKSALLKAGKGNFTMQLPIHINDEIGDLYLAFNEMITNLRTITISRDRLNEEIKARQKVEGQVSLLTRAIENSPVVKIITDKQGNITYVNKKFEESTGYTQKEVIGKNPKVLSSGLHPPEFYKEMWDSLLNKGYWRGQIQDKNKAGTKMWQDVSMSVIRDDTGEITHFVSSQIDVTDRVLMEEELVKNAEILEKSRKAAFSLMQDANIQKEETQKALKQLEASQKELSKLTLAIEQSPITVLITDVEGKIEYVNPYFSIATGYAPEDVIGKKPSILKSKTHAKSFYKTLWDTIKSGESWRGEIQNKKKNGVLFWESATISPIFSDQNHISHFVAIKEDISLRKSLENEATLNRLRLIRHQNALNDITQGNIFINPNFNGAIQELTRQAAYGLDVERASIWLFTDSKKDNLQLINLYTKKKMGIQVLPNCLQKICHYFLKPSSKIELLYPMISIKISVWLNFLKIICLPAEFVH